MTCSTLAHIFVPKHLEKKLFAVGRKVEQQAAAKLSDRRKKRSRRYDVHHFTLLCRQANDF